MNAIATDLRTQEARRRIAAFEKRYGSEVLDLACHAAFPLSLTPELAYCIRENFVPNCHWFAVPDLLLSSLCDPTGAELYEMDGRVRCLLLERLRDRFGKQRVMAMADFMEAYICHRIGVEKDDRWRDRLGAKPQWTALAYLRPSEAVETIRKAVQAALNSRDGDDLVRLAALAESYTDILSEYEFAPVLVLSDLLYDLQPFEFETATVTLNRRKNVTIERDRGQAWQFIEDIANGIELEMVSIPGGTFVMGSPEDEPERLSSESPQHEVTVPPFFMGKYQVTQAQWRAVAQLPKIDRDLDPDPSRFKGDDRPVERVSWYDAVEFCQRLSQATGREYRLPSEAEWEYACRAGTTTPFHFGETITGDLANYDSSVTYANGAKSEWRQETTPVGSFPANPFGLYDMHGNLWEWCADDWHNNYEGAPDDGGGWLDNCTENGGGDENRTKTKKLLRAGSWSNFPGVCRCAFRSRGDPGDRDGIIVVYGFRVCCPLARTL